MKKVDPVRIVLSVSIWFLFMVAGTGYYIWLWMNTPYSIDESNRNFTIARGESLYGVANDLRQRNMLRWSKAWVFYARLTDMAAIKAGEYKLSEKESPLSLLTRFQSGNVKQFRITLVEGLTFKKFLENLHNHQGVTPTLKGKSQKEILQVLDLDIDHPEGWFFPDTYQFSRDDTDVAILQRAHKKMREVLEEEWANRGRGLPYKTPYEALILASIVEKETGVAYERKQIAGVFVRRLKKKMRLATDPTIIYGLGDGFDGNLRKSDLTKHTPYNTYLIKGLPPTPIANPGLHAIQATLNPEKDNSLYFVAKGDGTHYFSETYKEHKKAVRKYQLSRKKDYRSSPEPVRE